MGLDYGRNKDLRKQLKIFRSLKQPGEAAGSPGKPVLWLTFGRAGNLSLSPGGKWPIQGGRAELLQSGAPAERQTPQFRNDSPQTSEVQGPSLFLASENKPSHPLWDYGVELTLESPRNSFSAF